MIKTLRTLYWKSKTQKINLVTLNSVPITPEYSPWRWIEGYKRGFESKGKKAYKGFVINAWIHFEK